MPGKGNDNFRVSTKVYYQAQDNQTLPPAEGNCIPNKDSFSQPVHVLHSATDRSLVLPGEFDAFPVAKTASPTKLFRFASQHETSVFTQSSNGELQLKTGKNTGLQKVSFRSSDPIDSEDVLKLECLQGGAFKMHIPSSPELSRPPLCFEIKPPAKVILDLPKCQQKPNIKVMVTTICSTGNPHEKSHEMCDDEIDVEKSNVIDPEIEDLIRELCQVIVESHHSEQSNSQRINGKEPPQVVELYKRKIMPTEENSDGVCATFDNAECNADSPLTYEYEDDGYFYLQPQTEPRGSSVSLFIDKVCSCLGKTFGLISSKKANRRAAPLTLEVDNDPEEGYVRCLLMGKTPTAEGDDCVCDQQPFAEIRNSAGLIDKQSPLIDRIMYLLRKSVSQEYSSAALNDDSGNGDGNRRNSENNWDGSAGPSSNLMGDQEAEMDKKLAKKSAIRKSPGTKHDIHTRFQSKSGNEMFDEADKVGAVEAVPNYAKKEDTSKNKMGDASLRPHPEGHSDKQPKSTGPTKRLSKRGSHGIEGTDRGAEIFKKRESVKRAEKIAVDDDKEFGKNAESGKKRKSEEKMEEMDVEDQADVIADKAKLSESVDSIKRPYSGKNRRIHDKATEGGKKRKSKEKLEKIDVKDHINSDADKPKPSESFGSIKRPHSQKGGKKEETKAAENDKRSKNKKKAVKSSDDASTSSSSKSDMKKPKQKEGEKSHKHPNDYDRKKMISPRDKEYWASYRRLRRRQMDKPEIEYKESVISANLLVDPLQISTDSLSDSLLVVVDSAISTRKKIRKPRITADDISGKCKSYGKSRPLKRSVSVDSSDSSQNALSAKSSAAETRQRSEDTVKSEKSKSSRKRTFGSKSSKEKPFESLSNELTSKNSQELVPRGESRDVSVKSKTPSESKSGSKYQCETEYTKPSHRRHHRRKQPEDIGIKMYISGLPKEQDEKPFQRNISEVVEVQALKDKAEKTQMSAKEETENVVDSGINSLSSETRTYNDSTINLVIPCCTNPSEESNLIALSSWENPITKSTTKIDNNCETLCSICMQSIASSATIDQASETTPSPSTSIASRKSILVERRQSSDMPRCSASVYSMCEGSPEGSILPVVASLDSKLRQKGYLEKLASLDSPIGSLLTATDTSDQTLDSYESVMTNNSSSVEVETKSTTFDSGTSVVSNVTIDSAQSQAPFSGCVESKDTSGRPKSSHKPRELSSRTVYTWSTSSVSDIQGNQSSTSNQESVSANDSACGLSTNGSRSLINGSVIEPLPSDLKCDDGSLSLFSGTSLRDSRSTVALSATSTIASELSIGSQATSESIPAQDSSISSDIVNAGSVLFESRDSYQDDLRSQPSYPANETRGKASDTEQLKRGASEHSMISEMNNFCSSKSAIPLKRPMTSVACSTTSLLLSNASQTELNKPLSVVSTSEQPAVIKIRSDDTVLTVASKADAFIGSPSRVSSTGSINKPKHVCYQVPATGPTFSDAMISPSATSPEANDETSRTNSEQGPAETVEPIVEAESSVNKRTTSKQAKFEKLSNGNAPQSSLPELPIGSDKNLLCGETNLNISEEKLTIRREIPPAETLGQLPKENLAYVKTIADILVEKEKNANEAQPSRKHVSKRRHNIMGTFLCISKPCQSGRHSEDSLAPYRPAQNFPSLNDTRNLSDTIPQTDNRRSDKPHKSKRPLFDHFRSKKTAKENAAKENSQKSRNEVVKLKSILSNTLHKENRYKLTKKVSFSPNPSFIEAAATSDASTSLSQSDNEAELETGATSSQSRALRRRSSSCDSILPLTASTEDLRKAKTPSNARTSLGRPKGSFSGETNRDSQQSNARRFEQSQSHDSDTGSSREDEDDTTFATNSVKSRGSFQARLQLSNLMCESIPSKSSQEDLDCVALLAENAKTCGFGEDGSEESLGIGDECYDRKDNENERESDNEEFFSQNISLPVVKDSKMCLIKKQEEKCKLFSKSRTISREIDFLKDFPIENEDAELEKKNSERKFFKKRQLFAQKVSSLIKVTPLEEYDEKMAIPDCDPNESRTRKEKKFGGKTSRKNKQRDDDSSHGQRSAPNGRIEGDRPRKASR